jgi:hypothetical protein
MLNSHGGVAKTKKQKKIDLNHIQEGMGYSHYPAG